MEINIDEYISEEEKREIAIDVFRQQVKTQLFKSRDDTVQSDSEIQRVIGNITHEIVFTEVQKYIPDVKEKIQENVIRVVNKDLTHHIFRKKDAWGKSESLAVTYLNDTVKENEGNLKTRIKEYMMNFDLSEKVNSEVSNMFSEIADSFFGLSDLFHNKKK